RRHGIIGNFSSMGLALQALETSSEFYAPRKWDRAQAFSVVCNHDYQQPTAMAQVLPPLVDKSYLNAGRWGCAATTEWPRANSGSCHQCWGQLGFRPGASPVGMTPLPCARWAVPGAHLLLSPPTAPITVHYSITNTLKNFFHYTTSVCVPDNSTLLQVMEVARNEKPDIFCFTIKMDKLGPYVTSIHGLAGNMANRTYWQFFSSWSRLQKGVGTYKPRDGEHIQAIFST
ncbi:IF factor, partial [Copsychus sechellarum]|nr:IF factor [Copsychus sechellarum]